MCNLPTVKKFMHASKNYAKQIKLSPTSGALCLSLSVNVDSTGPAKQENTEKNGNGLRCLKLRGYLSQRGGRTMHLSANVLIINI